MATPLIWQACSFSNSFYDLVLRYPHIVTIEVSTQRIKIEERRSRLLPFYLAQVPILIHLILSLLIGWQFINCNSAISLDIFVFSIAIGTFALLVIGLHLVLCKHGRELCHLYFNTLLKMDTQMNDIRIQKRNHTSLSKVMLKGKRI